MHNHKGTRPTGLLSSKNIAVCAGGFKFMVLTLHSLQFGSKHKGHLQNTATLSASICLPKSCEWDLQRHVFFIVVREKLCQLAKLTKKCLLYRLYSTYIVHRSTWGRLNMVSFLSSLGCANCQTDSSKVGCPLDVKQIISLVILIFNTMKEHLISIRLNQYIYIFSTWINATMHKHHHPTNFRGYAPVVIKRWATAVYAAVWRVSIPTAKKCLTCDAFCLTLWKSKRNISHMNQQEIQQFFFLPGTYKWCRRDHVDSRDPWVMK